MINYYQAKLSKNTIVFGITVLFISCFVTGASAAQEINQQKKPVEFGVMPHLSTSHLESTFGKIAVIFESAIGQRVNFNAQLSLDFFQKDLDSGRYDVVFMQPFDYVIAHDKNGYEVMATQKTKLFGVLSVRPGSDIRKISDLQGRSITLPPSHTAVSYLVKDWLLDTGYLQSKKVELRYETSHISCLQKALFGFAEVCGTAMPVLQFLREKFGFEFRVIAETQRIPHTLFAVHPRVSNAMRQKILKVIMNLKNIDGGKEILEEARLKEFRVVQDNEYDQVRKILRHLMSAENL